MSILCAEILDEVEGPLRGKPELVRHLLELTQDVNFEPLPRYDSHSVSLPSRLSQTAFALPVTMMMNSTKHLPSHTNVGW